MPYVVQRIHDGKFLTARIGMDGWVPDGYVEHVQSAAYFTTLAEATRASEVGDRVWYYQPAVQGVRPETFTIPGREPFTDPKEPQQ